MTNALTSLLPRRFALRRFRHDERAIGAIEFALIFPMLLTILIGTWEYVRFTAWARHVSQLADTAAEVASTNSATLTDSDVHFIWDSALAIIPDVKSFSQQAGTNWWEMVRVRVSSATMKKLDPNCISNCLVQARLDWSAGADSLARVCGTLSPVADDQTTNPATIPMSMLVVSSAIIADVEADYKPTIGAGWIPNFTLRRSAFFVPRTQIGIPYNPGSPVSLGYVCP